MKGWRPSAYSRLGNRFGLVSSGCILAGHRIDGFVLFHEVPVPGLMTLGSGNMVPSVPALEARGRQVGRKRRPTSRGRKMAPALHLLCDWRIPKRRQKEQRTWNEQATSTPPMPPPRPETGLRRKKCLGGRRKSLIRPNSAKEIQGFEFGFRSAGFGICSIRLGFRSEKVRLASGGRRSASPDHPCSEDGSRMLRPTPRMSRKPHSAMVTSSSLRMMSRHAATPASPIAPRP